MRINRQCPPMGACPSVGGWCTPTIAVPRRSAWGTNTGSSNARPKKAFPPRCRTASACAAEAQHALATFLHGWQAPSRHAGTVPPRPRDSRRGRPSQDTPPAQIAYHLPVALASSLAAHEALVAPHRWFIFATHALDERPLPAQALLAGYQGQQHAERGFRFL
jgi:hypothetical protein